MNVENVRLHREISLFLLLHAPLDCVCIILSSSDRQNLIPMARHTGGRVRGQWTGWTSFSVASSAFLFSVVFLALHLCETRHRSWAFRDARYDYFTFSILFLFFFSACFNTSWLCEKVSSVEEFFFGNVLHRISHIFIMWIRDVALAYLTFSRQRQRATTSGCVWRWWWRRLCTYLRRWVLRWPESCSVSFVCFHTASVREIVASFFGLSCLMERKNQVFIVTRAQLQSVELSPNANVHYIHDSPKKTAHAASFGWRRWWWWW